MLPRIITNLKALFVSNCYSFFTDNVSKNKTVKTAEPVSKPEQVKFFSYNFIGDGSIYF